MKHSMKVVCLFENHTMVKLSQFIVCVLQSQSNVSEFKFKNYRMMILGELLRVLII